ncbi:uncharacterized protein LOC110849810 [Folsomia candida]|uniref:Uncharacterized protein n=1 Tax=Folsomia candida TaxID=158441 RepID=A0A226EC39_FOLCA|nr:uncharacterized protein LOC110849810 [Folsomia candida]OXA55123.1 hypothetical protein Fcan01_10738 [Folsomia candida]
MSRYLLLLSLFATSLSLITTSLAQDNCPTLQLHSNCTNRTNVKEFDKAYDNSPTKLTTSPTVVTLTANAKLVAISDAPEPKVSINFDIWQSWNDVRLAFHEASSLGCNKSSIRKDVIYPPLSIWVPSMLTGFYNIGDQQILIGSNGDVFRQVLAGIDAPLRKLGNNKFNTNVLFSPKELEDDVVYQWSPKPVTVSDNKIRGCGIVGVPTTCPTSEETEGGDDIRKSCIRVMIDISCDY